MKSPLRKLRGLAHHHRSESKDKKDRRNRTPARLDDLVQATQDMLDMRSCYDSLLSAAAATANSAYEFSEALEEMGTCLLKKTALNEDEDSGRVLLMLGKVQFELQKLVDSYRVHVIQTITTPSESLLKELQTVEEMKRQCDDKRELYKFMLAAHKEKGKSKHSKSETVSSKQLQEAEDDYEEEANLFVFRLKSLKQGQSRSLLTQAARHHASQLNFFRKALKSLETVEPHIKVVADREHIDYQFSGLEDDIEDDYDDDYYSYDDNDDGELSFDYGQSSDDEDSVSPARKSMEVDQIDKSAVRASTTGLTKVNINRSHSELIDFSKRPSPVTQSAPIFPDNKFDPPEKVKELRPSLSRKLNTYVLPTPVDSKRVVSTGSISPPLSAARMNRKVEDATHLWHSSPLDPSKFNKNSRDNEFLIRKAHPATIKESNINQSPIRIPTSSSQELPLPNFNQHTHSDTKKIRRYAFSGPITRRPWSEKPNLSATDIMPSVEHPPVSTTPARVRTSGASISPRASPSISPPPRISELHELPRPPVGSTRSTRPTSLIGHSAPLVYRGQEQKKANRALPAATASPLPTPPAAVHRSFSIPSRRTPISPVAKFLDNPDNRGLAEDVASPPLTPILLTNNRPVPQASRVRS